MYVSVMVLGSKISSLRSLYLHMEILPYPMNCLMKLCTVEGQSFSIFLCSTFFLSILIIFLHMESSGHSPLLLTLPLCCVTCNSQVTNLINGPQEEAKTMYRERERKSVREKQNKVAWKRLG